MGRLDALDLLHHLVGRGIDDVDAVAGAIGDVDESRPTPRRERCERQHEPQVPQDASIAGHGNVLTPVCDGRLRSAVGKSRQRRRLAAATLAAPACYRIAVGEGEIRRRKCPVTPATSPTAASKGLSAITINAHSTEVASCSFEEQRRVLAIAQEEIGDRLPLVNGVWADGSIEAARIARMAADGGASALLIFPPAPFTLGQSPEMALAHFERIADATDLPLIAFQDPLATGQG